MTEENENAGNPANDKDKIDNISSRLSKNNKEETGEREGEPRVSEAVPFDLAKLSSDQLQQLKSMLAVTPDRPTRKKANPITTIRVIKNKYAIAIKNAYLALAYDPTRLTEVETHKIPVKFYGEEKFIDILYTDFMSAERTPCEILSIRQEQTRRVEGEVISKITGKLVELEAIIVNYFYTIKLPNGKTVEIDGSAANA